MKLRRSAPVLAAAGLAALALAGCATPSRAPPPATARTPTEYFKPEVVAAPDQVAIGVHAEGLSANQRQVLAGVAQRWKDEGAGPIILESAAGTPEAAQAQAMAYGVQAFLETEGVPPEGIRLATYPPEGPHAPVLVRFRRFEAEIPDCSKGWGDLGTHNWNEPYAHFGCAVTANVAAQLADPRDLTDARRLDPSDGTRRQTILGLYRQGKTTSSETDAQSKVKLSTAVRQ